MNIPPRNPNVPKPIALPREGRSAEIHRGPITSPPARVPEGTRFPAPGRPNGCSDSPAHLRDAAGRPSSYPAGDTLPRPIEDDSAQKTARRHNFFTPITGEAEVELPPTRFTMDEGLRRQANATAFGTDLAPRGGMPEPGNG